MTDRNTKIRGTQIHDDTITEAKLAIFNSPTNGYFLQWNASEGKFEWVAGLDAITEYPSGLINSSNKVFTLSYTPESGSLSLYLNGLYQEEGSGNDYILTGDSITFTDAPLTEDLIIASYATDQVVGGGGASELNELSDVDFDSGTPTDNQVLTYDSGTSKWKAEDPSSTSYTTSFVNGDLSSSKITITHSLGLTYPLVVVYDDSDNIIQPTEITYKTTDTVELDFTDMTPLIGTYNVRVIG